MSATDPVTQAEEILMQEQARAMAEAAKREAEMALLAATHSLSEVQAGILHSASSQGPEYTSMVMTGCILSARNWAVSLTNASREEMLAVMQEPDEHCTAPRAHVYVRRLLCADDVDLQKAIAISMAAWLRTQEAPQVGAFITHIVSLSSELVEMAMKGAAEYWAARIRKDGERE